MNPTTAEQVADSPFWVEGARWTQGFRPLDTLHMLQQAWSKGDTGGQFAEGAHLGLELLSLALDPFKQITAVVTSWFIDHMAWSRNLLEKMTGDPIAIYRAAEQYKNHAVQQRSLADGLKHVLEQWHGESREAFDARRQDMLVASEEAAKSLDAMADVMQVAGGVSAVGRSMLRDFIAEFMAELVRSLLFLALRPFRLGALVMPSLTVGCIASEIIKWSGRFMTGIGRIVTHTVNGFKRARKALEEKSEHLQAVMQSRVVRSARTRLHDVSSGAGTAIGTKGTAWVENALNGHVRSRVNEGTFSAVRTASGTDFLPAGKHFLNPSVLPLTKRNGYTAASLAALSIPAPGGGVLALRLRPKGDLFKASDRAAREVFRQDDVHGTQPVLERLWTANPGDSERDNDSDEDRSDDLRRGQEQPDSRADGGEPDTPDAVPDELRDGDTSDDEERDSTDDRTTDNRADGLQNSMRRPPAGVVAPVPAPPTPKSATPPDSPAAFPEMLPPAAMLPRFDDVEVPQPPARYVVRQGDSLSSISAEYVTTPAALYDLNREVIVDPDVIYPGQQLKTR